MIEMKVDTRNREVIANIGNIGAATRRGLRQGLFKFGKDLVKTFNRQVLSKNKTGRVYRIRRGSRIINHRSSASGESPANLSGKYRKSVGFNIFGSNRMIFGAGNSGVPYATFLENGTSKMKERPGLGNAVKATERNAIKYLASGIKSELKK